MGLSKCNKFKKPKGRCFPHFHALAVWSSHANVLGAVFPPPQLPPQKRDKCVDTVTAQYSNMNFLDVRECMCVCVTWFPDSLTAITFTCITHTCLLSHSSGSPRAVGYLRGSPLNHNSNQTTGHLGGGCRLSVAVNSSAM